MKLLCIIFTRLLDENFVPICLFGICSEAYSSGLAYAQAKLCQASAAVSWSKYVEGKAEFNGHPIVFASVHPGIVATNLFAHTCWYNPLTAKFLPLTLMVRLDCK
jgi:hypothetical protein